VEMREAIRVLQPRYVIWENVRGALSTQAASAMESDPRLLGDHRHGVPVLRALGRVLGDLADLGYDAVWHGLHAGCKRHSVGTCRECAGAPHGRFRIFVIATNTRGQAWLQRAGLREGDPGRIGWGRPDNSSVETQPLACPDCGHTEAAHRFYSECTGTAQQPDCICTRTPDRFVLDLLPTPTSRDHKGRNQRNDDTCLAGAHLPTPRATRGGSSTETVELLPTPSAGNFNASEDPDQWEARRQRVKATANNGNGMGMPLGIAVKLLPTPKASNNEKRQSDRYGMNLGQALGVTPSAGHERRGIATHNAWGPYAAAIARWEAIVGPAPAPTKPGRNGRPKLNPAFAEWMMGAPAGWITNTPGVTDSEALHMAGNGVVRQQAVAAIRLMLNRMEVVV